MCKKVGKCDNKKKNQKIKQSIEIDLQTTQVLKRALKLLLERDGAKMR